MSRWAHQYSLFEPRAQWAARPKGDLACLELADRHYSRQTPGSPQWTRPGYTFVLFAYDARGEASWCWWRPKWEAGIERKDGLRVLECTLFRNETNTFSSVLIRQAVDALETEEAKRALHHTDPRSLPLITGINSEATRRHRGRRNLAGHCFRMAGWKPFEKASTHRADVWLRAPKRGEA